MPAVVLHGVETDLDSTADRAFVVDVVRTAESLNTDDDLRRKYEISPREWGALIDDAALIKAVRNERDRRVRSGIAAREAAAKIHAKAPAVLGDILHDKAASPRHRIESARELRATAAGADGGNAASTNTTFNIIIDLSAGGGEVERYTKTLAPTEPAQPEHGFRIIGDE